MSQPKRWWIGLLPLGLIWFIANWLETPRVEQDILNRTGPAITAATKDMTRRTINVAGRDVTISGEALPGDGAKNATEAVMQLAGPRLVNVAVSTAAIQRPYSLVAERAGNAVTLSGFAPAADAKDRMIAAVRSAFPGATVNETVALAAGAPPQFEPSAAHGLQQLAKLSRGKFSLSDQTYSLEGLAVDSAAYAALSGLGGALPAGFRAGTIAITAPPVDLFTFAAKRAGDTLTLTGYVPDAATREKLLAAAKAANPGLKIVDELLYASVAPQGFEPIASHGLGLAGKLASGAFSLSGNTYNLSGSAPDSAAYGAALAALKALPTGASAGKIEVLPPEIKPFAWSVRHNSDGSIVLEGGVPGEDVRKVILAQAQKLYPNAKIEDRMFVARTAPAGFAAAANVALEQAGKLKGGFIGLADGALTLQGEADDKSIADAVASSLSGLGNAFRIATNSISFPAPKPVAPPPPPPAPVAPDVKVEVAIPPPPPLSLPEPAPPAAIVAAPPIPAPLSVLPPQVPSKPAFSCTVSGKSPILAEAIFFEEGQWQFGPADEKVLTGLLDALRTCKAARVELVGHTNSHGPRVANIRLSSLRTFAVSRWLQKNGIPKARISTIGFGEDRPLLPETTAEAVAKNRRVEVNIR